MDDLISRQSVIDKLKREEKIFYSPAGLKYLIGAVRDLPSAQPETHDKRTETRACDLISRQAAIKTALEFFVEFLGGAFDENSQKELIARFQRLPSTQQWIPVTVGLPVEKQNENTHDFEYVLCTTTFGDVRPYKFGCQIGAEKPHFWHGAGNMDDYVIAWMPLPEPYKGAKHENGRRN